MGFDVDQERELEQYCVARFSSEDKDELVRDLMFVAFTVKKAEVYARVERVIERFRSSDDLYIVDCVESAAARFDSLRERFRLVNQPTVGLSRPGSLQSPYLPFPLRPMVNFENKLEQLEPCGVTVDGRKLYIRSEVEQVMEDLTKNLLLQENMRGPPPDIPTWPSLHLKSIALAQLAARSFSDFVAIICDALPRQAADLGRRRAAIVALAFGHLGLCKVLLDNEEVPECQRVARLFQPPSQFCCFPCIIDKVKTSAPPLMRDKLGHVMEAVVRGNSNRIAWALGRQAQPFDLKTECNHRGRHLTSGSMELTKLLQRRSKEDDRGYDRVLVSPIDAAIVQGHATVLEELLSCLPKFDPRWGDDPQSQRYSLRLACLRGDLEIFEMLLNVRHPAQLYLREEALEVISQYGRLEFLRQYVASQEYGFTQWTVGPNLKRCVKTAISHHQKDYLVDLFAEFEKYNLNLGSLPWIVLGTVLAEKSLPLLHSYLLASASFLARFPRSITSKEIWLLDKIDWPEGRAVLVDEEVLVGEKPRSLFVTCLTAVRRNLRHPFTETAQQLPLPKILKQRLLFKLDA